MFPADGCWHGSQVVDVTRLQEVRVAVQYRYQVVGILMTGTTAEVAVVGILKCPCGQAAVPFKGVVTIVTGGVGVIQIHPIRPSMAVNADLLGSPQLIEIRCHEITVVTLVDVEIGCQGRIQRNPASKVVWVCQPMGIVTPNTSDILILFSKD